MRNERGFTLPELMVVTAIVLLILGTSMLLLRSKDYTAANQDAERQLHIATIAQALSKYKGKNGSFPADLPKERTEIGSVEDSYDLCKTLFPAFIKEMPLNPGLALTVKGDEGDTNVDKKPCANAKESQYLSGYTVLQAADGHVEVGATASNGAQISISVH
jgi:prepilin-type N-terminal cleavage/methylation domain-containing protein